MQEIYIRLVHAVIVLLILVVASIAFARSDGFSQQDRNADGVVSAKEWSGSRAEFLKRDHNRNAVLSRTEFSVNGKGSPGSDFEGLDRDGNGLLNLREWNEGREAFSRCDVNRDRAVSRMEYYSRQLLTGIFYVE